MTSATNQVIQVVMCANAGFVVPLAVALRSINDARAEASTVHVTVLSLGIGPEDRARILASVDRIAVSFIDAERLIPDDLPRVKPRLTRATYGRLLAADAVPNAGRLIYLDTDVLVLDDLSFLANVDLAGHPVAATLDVSQPALSVGFPAWRELGMLPKTPYYNAGVLVIDVQAWHTRGIRASALNFLYRNANHCLYADQDGLNGALQGDIARLPARWNQDAAFRQPRHLGYFLLDEAEVEAAVRTPAIVHFTGSTKPWLPGCSDSATGMWRQSLALTDFREFTVKEPILVRMRRSAERIPLLRRAARYLRSALE